MKQQKILLFLGSLFFISLTFAAQKSMEPVSTGRFNNTAIGGYDTVAYHQSTQLGLHQEVKGKKVFSVTWKGAQWRFASRESAERFEASPKRYAPAYNGFCANALSLGEGLILTSGTVWEFFGEELYLFYAERGRTSWLEGNWRESKQRADEAWARLKLQ